MTLREATNADTSGILACLSAAFEVYRDSYTPDAFADTVLTPETLQQRLQEMTIFVVTNTTEEIVGTISCCVVNSEEVHVRGMAVLPTSQGSRIAARLLAHAEGHSRQRICKRISLDTTAPLKRAIRFYERSGFSPSGKVRCSQVTLASGPANTNSSNGLKSVSK